LVVANTGLQKLEFLENSNFLALAQPTLLNLLIHAQAELVYSKAELLYPELELVHSETELLYSETELLHSKLVLL